MFTLPIARRQADRSAARSSRTSRAGGSPRGNQFGVSVAPAIFGNHIGVRASPAMQDGRVHFYCDA
jgi:hypothetical protein